jgi:hypothetical protein
MATRREAAVTVALLAATVRQSLALRGIARSHRFLRTSHTAEVSIQDMADHPLFFVVLPVLRETAILADTVDHFSKMTDGYRAEIVIVTTERERTQHRAGQTVPDTIDVAARLAAEGKCHHLHYPDPRGVKADQLNFVADSLAARLNADQVGDVFLLCYDADSRPPLDSLAAFMSVLSANPDADVLHQSSRFEVRDRPTSSVLAPISEAGALRANHFVLAYELPRLLNKSPAATPLKRMLSSYVYAHVTGHGLCLRLSLLLQVPFPARSPLEDMHYSFILDSRNISMYPVPSLDVADVPSSLRVQVEQAARWFYGPGRFRRYRRDPDTTPGVRAWMLSASAAAICVEWLSCAVVPTALAVLLRRGPRSARYATATFIGVYATQLAVTDALTSPPSPAWKRLVRLTSYPVSCSLFGMGGVAGAARLGRGASGWGKTERPGE